MFGDGSIEDLSEWDTSLSDPRRDIARCFLVFIRPFPSPAAAYELLDASTHAYDVDIGV